MHQLTIDTDTVTCTTGHDDDAQARRALLDYAIAADLYLHDKGSGRDAHRAPHVRVFRLLRLDPASREPLRVGTATITAPTPALSTTGTAAS